MATTVADMSMSLDGFVADLDDAVDQVFTWYSQPQPERGANAANGPGLGLIVYGRRTFEVANGWNGNHPMGVPVIVVTHNLPDGWPREESTVSFVTGGIETAIERAKTVAGEQVVAIGSPSIAQQCINLGLLDELRVSLVPVLLGDGVRFFANLTTAPVGLGDPTVAEGNGVTHLHYRIR